MSDVVVKAIDYERVMALGRSLLEALGEDPAREGLQDTPRRFANYWREFIEYDPGRLETTFEAVRSGGLVVVSGMRVWSVCEHHLLPFFCDVSVGYVVGQKVVGLSKFPRLVHYIAHRLQLQENIVDELADAIENLAESPDVIVHAKGIHLCMVSRGIRTDGTSSTLVGRGVFADHVERRAEFLELANASKVTF